LSKKECENLFGEYVQHSDQIDFLKSKAITKEQADYLLKNDIQNAVYQLLAKIPSIYGKMNSARKAVLIDMCFNMGIKSLLKFKQMLFALEMNDFEKASDEILDSDYARIDVPNRAKRNAQIMSKGVF